MYSTKSKEQVPVICGKSRQVLRFFIAARAMAMLCLAVLLFLRLGVANAEEGSAARNRQSQAIRAEIFEQLSKAQEAQEKGKLGEALKYLDAVKERSSKKPLQPYEEAQLWNFYAYIYLAQEKYDQAVTAFGKVLAQPDLPEGLLTNTQYALAQLYMMQGESRKAIKQLEQWFVTVKNPGPDAYVLLGQAYLQENRQDDALKALLSAFDVAKQQGKAEKENWYALLQYIYAEKQLFNKQEEVLKILVSRWPKKLYWLSLFGVYSELGNEVARLNVLETAYVQGMLDQKNYVLTLAQLLASNGMPYKAAKVLEKGMADKLIEPDADNLERVGEYWRLAQEVDKALPYLVQAAKNAKDGKPGMRLAYLYLSLYQYDNAAKQIRESLARGGVSRPIEAQILLGTALFHAKQYEQATRVFEAIVKAPQETGSSKYREQALQWLELIKSELKRIEEIKTYLVS